MTPSVSNDFQSERNKLKIEEQHRRYEPKLIVSSNATASSFHPAQPLPRVQPCLPYGATATSHPRCDPIPRCPYYATQPDGQFLPEKLPFPLALHPDAHEGPLEHVTSVYY